MEDSSNFIPLGIPRGKLPFDRPAKPERPPRIEGATPGERKQIAREIRNGYKKEKKFAKAEAKRARKQNAIMHRRMTKNPEKYIKNKDRNRLRALDAERNKIRKEAVHQAERLAAKHDPSGKMFNVGEVVVLEDGSVRSKEALAAIAAKKDEREAEKAAQEAEKLAEAAEGAKKKKPHVSKKQLKRQAALAPRPVPPKPVIPEGVTLPKGEENWIAMWDITDEEIAKRMSAEKRVKSLERKNLRRRQKEQKKINGAMKILKKQTENRGETWDPKKALAIVMMQQAKEESEEDSQDSESEEEWEDVGGEEKEDGEEHDEAEEPVEATTVKSKNSSKSKKPSEETANGDVASPEASSHEKTSKRPAEDESVEEPKAKKSKKSKKSHSKVVEEVEAPDPVDVESGPATTEKQKKKKDKKASTPQKVEVDTEEQAKLEKKAAKKEKKRQEKESAQATKVAGEAGQAAEKKAPKKRKREEDESEPTEKGKSHKKKSKTSEPSSIAEQWNPEALTGDAARKDKFLRLLGAGKSNGLKTGTKHMSGSKVEEITKVQSELERQYEAGMKLKHDGGSKRRGLGA